MPDANACAWPIHPGDRQVLRALATRQRELSELPIMEQRRRMWRRHASLQGDHPIILTELRDAPDDFMPVSALQCQESWARDLERTMRLEQLHAEIGDDYVFEPFVPYEWKVTISDFGVPVDYELGTVDGHPGSSRWDAPIKDLDRDFDRLRHRSFTVDRAATMAWKTVLEEVFDGILPIWRRGIFWWSMGLTHLAIQLIGLEGLMWAMVDNPDGLHRLMAFLRDDQMALITWTEREGLLNLHHANDSLASGTLGYSTELPRPDWSPGCPIRLKDLWGFAESQETVGVSPAMFAEFVLPYQLPLLAKFGPSYYGCCEPLHTRWSHIQAIPNLRRVSISPWCDEAYMAQALGRDFIYCRKPNPTLISTERFDEEEIRADLRHTLTVAAGCHIEFSMKDVRTVRNQPWRMRRWVELAREMVDTAVLE